MTRNVHQEGYIEPDGGRGLQFTDRVSLEMIQVGGSSQGNLKSRK